jgi:hypothetical protein
MDSKILFPLQLILFAIHMNFASFIDEKATGTAIKQVVDEFYIKPQIRFSIVYNNKRNYYQGVLSHFLMQINGNATYYIIKHLYNIRTEIRIDHSSIIFVHSCDGLRNLHKTATLNNDFHKVIKFLIYINKCGLKKLKTNIENLVQNRTLTFGYGKFEMYEYMLVDDENFVYLTTLEWYTEHECNNIQLVVLNPFDKKFEKWYKKLENYEKFKVSFLKLFIAMVIICSVFNWTVPNFENFKP